VKELSDPNIRYKLEGGKLLTDSSEVQLVYVSRVEDVSQYDALFTEALILSLASKLSYILIGSNSRDVELKEELRLVLFSAKMVDGQDDTPDSLNPSTFLDAKRYGSWSPWYVDNSE
jgi:hypothetical protein